MDLRQRANELLGTFKGEDFVRGAGCFDRLGALTAQLGRRASVLTSGVGKAWGAPIHEATRRSLAGSGVELAGDLIPGARPNAPREDVFRIVEALREQAPDVVVAVGGGSGIDACKAAVAYLALGDRRPDLDDYFGVGQVSAMLEEEGRRMLPIVASALAAGAAAHLTKYSNITNFETAQKMLIVDEAIVPPKALFDYSLTRTCGRDLTMDGALDGIAHCLEVYMGVPDDKLAQAEPICLSGIELVVSNVKRAVDDPNDIAAREGLGLGTDLGGYAIMVGGTNGAHLNSFSMVDVLTHGRACAVMNPYYVAFFAPAIEARLRKVADIYKRAGYSDAPVATLAGPELGIAAAEAMVSLSGDIGFPTTLDEVAGFDDAHVERCLTAAKNPKLESKLKNMPVQLSAETVDEYMGAVLEAARTGDFSRIRHMG